MIESGIVLVVGFVLGYAVRAYVSHRRRLHAKINRGLDQTPWCDGTRPAGLTTRQERPSRGPAARSIYDCRTPLLGWSNEQLRRRAARKERARIEQEEQWAKATHPKQSNLPSDTAAR